MLSLSFNSYIKEKISNEELSILNIWNLEGLLSFKWKCLISMVSKEILDQVQICTSIPGKVPIDPNKLNILWQKKFLGSTKLTRIF